MRRSLSTLQRVRRLLSSQSNLSNPRHVLGVFSSLRALPSHRPRYPSVEEWWVFVGVFTMTHARQCRFQPSFHQFVYNLPASPGVDFTPTDLLLLTRYAITIGGLRKSCIAALVCLSVPDGWINPAACLMARTGIRNDPGPSSHPTLLPAVSSIRTGLAINPVCHFPSSGYVFRSSTCPIDKLGRSCLQMIQKVKMSGVRWLEYYHFVYLIRVDPN